MNIKQLSFCIGLLLSSINTYAQEVNPVSPYRPSVSSPALLPVPGQLEFELGGLTSKQDDDKRSSLP
ncbi:MAG: hypothetical protein K2P84_12910, partial [Undibacterium sp.]|nr:hypothetical protein [Undibacterium sp.]